jgi:hypothetical protein
MNQRDKLADDLLRIRKHVLEDFVFWMQTDSDRNSDIAQLTAIRNGHSYPSLQKVASGILDFISNHLKFVATLKEGDLVEAMQTFDKVPKGSIGRYICKLTPKLSFIELDTGPIYKKSTLTLLLFSPVHEDIQTVLQEAAIDSASETSRKLSPCEGNEEPDIHQLVQQMFLEPNPTVRERKSSMGRPLGSKNKKKVKGQIPVIQVTFPGQLKKRGRKPGGKNKPKQVSQPLQTQAETPSSLDLPIQPSVEEVKVEQPVVAPIQEPSKAIMLYQPDRREETLPIRDLRAFEPGFLFAKIEQGARQIYVVRGNEGYLREKRVSLVCSKLDNPRKIWIDVLDFIHYDPPKVFTKQADMFFYLTPKEYQLVYTSPCFVGLPMRVQSIQEVMDTNILFQNRIVELLKRYAAHHQGFAAKQDVLAVFTTLAKDYILNEYVFSSIVQMVFNDSPADIYCVSQSFKKCLGDDAYKPGVSYFLSHVADEVRREERIRQMKTKMYTLTGQLQNLPDNTLQLLEDRLKDVDTPQ